MKTKIYILTLLALCMNVSLWAYDASNATIYYDNTASQWSKASILVGHDTWSTAYNMVAVSNTNLYYKTSFSWGGYTDFLFIEENWGNESGEGSGPNNRKNYASNYTGTYNLGYTKTHLFISTGTAKGANLTYKEFDSYTGLNYTQTIGVQLADGTTPTQLPATITAQSYVLNTASSSQSKTITLSAVSAITQAVHSSTMKLTVTNVGTGYTFEGWYDGSDNLLSSATAYSIVNVTGARTIYARFSSSAACTEPVITASTTSFSAESNKTFTLSGISVTPSCSYLWTADGGTLTDETTLTPVFTAASAGTYTLTLTAINGDCTATKEFTVTVTGGGTTVPDYYYRGTKNGWGDGEKLTPSPTGLYAYLERSGSDEFKIVPIKDSWNPQYNASNVNNNFFPGADVSLSGSDNITCSQSGTWYILVWYPKTDCNSSDKPVICASTTLPTGCTVEYAIPEITFTTSTFRTEVNTPLTLSGISVNPVCSYKWTADGGTLTDETTLTPVFSAASAGTYTLTLTATNGDKSKAATFTVEATPAIERPELYYMDEKVTKWGDEKGIQMSWNNEDHLYAYVERPAYSGTDNKFKIYPQNKHDDNLAYFGDSYINNGFAGTDIPLSADANWHNAKIGSTTSSYYVFLFMPNTSVNLSDKHILCAGYSLPVISDPYPVSFGVIDNQGGALTAKSGNRVIDSGDAVMSATFTAVPETGYTVEGWYTDIDGTHRIDAAGTETVYTLSQVTEDNSQVYVRFRQLTAVYFKQNGLNWNDVYLYLFSDNVWSTKHRTETGHTDEEKGVQPKVNRIGDVLQMKRVRDDIYGHVLTGQSPKYIAFAKDNQNDYDYLYQTEAVYLYQFTPDMPLFVHERGMAAYRTNEVNYYNHGIWMKYNSTESGYSLVWRQGNTETRVPFTAITAGGYKFEAAVQATAGQTYTLCVTNGRNEWYSVGYNAVLQGDEEAYRLYKWDDWASSPTYVSFTPSHSGDYTITLSLADGKVVIGFGEEPGDAYRLVYVERNGTTQVLCHPSHSVVPRTRVAVGSLVGDTISMHVRPMCKDAAGVESANPNTCEVWLQKMAIGTTKWTTVETIDVKQHASIKGNGVYNFVLRKQSEDNIGVLEVYPYTGAYYIRSDAAKRRGGVGFSDLNYIGNLMNRCYYSEYARNNETFDYYYCEWVTHGTDIRFTLATPYSYCIADILVRNTYEISNGFVGSDGKLSNDANVRFMWNSYDNSLNRAYLAGAGENVQLLSKEGIYQEAEGGNPQTKVCLKDRENWVYRADMYANANTFVKVLAPYQNVKQYFKGKEGDFTEENVYKLLGGKQTIRYKIRVLYDFKTNHLICSWLPGDQQITVEDEIETDLMIIRKNHEEAEQLTFDPNSTKLKQVNTAYLVLVLTKEYLEGKASSKEKSIYWISFPFDVMLSEVFGGGLEYGNDYMVQYYDGVARADKGCWSDSPTYWKYYEETAGVKLQKGFGYVIVLDWKRIVDRFFTAGNEEVCIYFPSANKEPMDISGEWVSVDVPAHPCSIERDNRYIYDSNWNLIGAPSFANIDQFGNPMPMEQIGNYKVGFLYEYDPNKICYNVNEAESIDFMSTYAYMVQFAGTIDWKEKNYSGTLPKELQARRVAGEEECYTLLLALSRNGKRLDKTYVRFRDGEATCEFDLNIDLTKIDNAGVSLYTLTDGDSIRVAANVQPVPVALKQIPVGVSLTQDGEYTFALPDGTEGMSVTLLDTETGIRTNLLFDSYTVTLAKGTYAQRFVLEVNPKQHIITASDNVGTEDNTIRKYLIDGNLYIRKDNRLYDVQGRQLKAW